MVNVGDVGEKIGVVGSKAITIGIWVVVIIIILAIVITLLIWSQRRKKWNLKVIVKLPRAGQLIFGEFAKGHYDVKAGIVDIKRKRLKAVGMKPFDVKRFLQGNKILEVLQVGATDFIPIDPKSYETLTEEYKDDEGKVKTAKHVLFEMFTDDSLKRKTWKNYMERSAKDRFTLLGFLDKHWRAIEISIIMFVIFLGFSIMWIRLPSICS